ncbi:RING finger protein 37 [Chironomus tepperi]|uniref:RING finger protein 37 n=1 Tax=Chironomus tepperi TaxID=113505 RepID=UPI00391F3808
MNLLDSKISEKIWKITSECVKDDHYSLENLISTDEAKRRIGFMAFSVSKPPITIILECKLKIDLNCIKIYSVLDSLRSTKFQVLVEFNEEQALKTKTIADITLEDEFNGFYVSKEPDTEANDASLKHMTIDDNLQKYIRNFNKLIIVIKDTKLKRAPVLKKIEIHGTFSDTNSKEEVDEILKLLNPPAIIENKENPPPQVPECSTSEEFQIPEEFLDAITMDILNLPYILPSGAIVDETTLQKHKRREECYGRYPSDPFTGVLFTANSEPKFDAALKNRLDEFKLKYSHEIEIKNSGRSVGRKEKLCEPSTSKQFNNHISKKIKLNKESSSLDDIIQSIYRNKQISSFINPQQPQSSINVCAKCNSKDNIVLYQISTCNHIFCKKCLVQSNSVCSTCSKEFESRHVVKLNL